MRSIKVAFLFVLIALASLGIPGSASAQFAWEPPTNKIVVLFVGAHPDDEGIFFGGTLPYYSAALGLPTMLLSMTSGDWQPANLTVREAELRCAAWTYGLRYEPLFPRFRDVPSHSMTGNPYPNKIDATWDYWADGVLQGDGSDVEAGKLKGINYVAEQIRRYRPEVIITHDEKGEYGHHNHIATAYAVTNAFYVAADPAASAPNLEGLPPWQVKKMYLHLYPSNRLFHTYLELPLTELSGRTARDLADEGLDCHVSQKMPDVSTVYRTGENFDPYPSEWWGLYASTVGPDTALTTDLDVQGYTVPAGASAGNFLENLGISNVPAPPVFVSDSFDLPVAVVGRSYSGIPLVALVHDPNLAWGDSLVFEKLSGPAWLSVSPAGHMSGTPNSTDVGTNVITLRVTDSSGFWDEAFGLVAVLDLFPEVPGLVGWWKLDETSGVVCADSSFPSQNGEYIGSVTLGQGGASPATGLSVRFDGFSGKMDVPYSGQLNPPVFTAALWAKVVGGGGTYRSPLTSRVAVPQAGYVFYAGPNNIWQFWLGTGSAWKTHSAGAVQTNVWMHLAGTYDGTTARFYTNGVLAASSATAFAPNRSSPLRIGAGGSEMAGQYWFPGHVDDVRVYSTVLSAAQIGSLYSNVPPRFINQPAAVSAFAGTAFDGTLASLASDPNPSDLLSYGKASGPAWLRVDADGAMSGMPASGDVGPNHFRVSVADSHGLTHTTSLDVYVLPGRLPALSYLQKDEATPFSMTFTGAEGQTYTIEASDSLAAGSWFPMSTNSSGATPFQVADPESSNRPQRFYRVVMP
jgi:LmbE family N-acetylglucosaminyl deacetylase